MIPLGYEIGSGRRVSVPLGHTIVLGQTQKSGKTTTLEAMTARSGVKAIAFITKRGEKSFRLAQPIPPYYSETSETQPYWKYVISIVESMQDVKLGFRERGWIMQLCRDHSLSKTETDAKGKKKRATCDWEEPKTLRDVLSNAQKAMAFSRGINEMICVQLVEYLKIAVPEIERAKLSSTLALRSGINVMDISKLDMSVQALIIRSVVERVYLHCKKTVVIIPEAWKFLPEGHTTPVSGPVEELIRQGAVIGNFVWIDLQDLRGIQKKLLRSIQVWLFGVQKEKNEVANTLASMPSPEVKPTAQEMMQLRIGEFLVTYDAELFRCYVQPAGMEDVHAQAIARGDERPESWAQIARSLDAEEKGDRLDTAREAGSAVQVGRDGLRGVPEEDSADASQSMENERSPSHVQTQPIGSADDQRAVAQLDQPEAGSPRAAESDAARVAQDPDREDPMWKEKYEALKAEFDELREAHDAMARRLAALEPPAMAAVTDYALKSPATMAKVSGLDKPVNGNGDLDDVLADIMERVIRRAARGPELAKIDKSPGTLRLLASRPELLVNLARPKVQLDGVTLRGFLAALIAEKFFDAPKNGNQAFQEAQRRGRRTAKPNVYRELDGLAELGFLTKEDAGYYQAVPGMKVNIVEERA